MGSDAEAADAVTKFHGKTIDGRPLTVNEARPKEDRPRTGGGGGFGGGGFRGDRGGSREGGYSGDRGGGGYRDR